MRQAQSSILFIFVANLNKLISSFPEYFSYPKRYLQNCQSTIQCRSFRHNHEFPRLSHNELHHKSHILPKDTHNFNLKKDEVVYNGWRKIVRRDVKRPDGRDSSFDIISGLPSTVVFTWDTKNNTTTLLKEYYPGTHQVMYGTVGGTYEEIKHKNLLQCAKDELEEEANLKSDRWYPLIDNDNNGIPFDKYSNCILHPYLALDCVLLDNPKPIDVDEWITIEHGVSYTRLMELVEGGKMTLPCVYCITLGLKKLKELGINVDT